MNWAPSAGLDVLALRARLLKEARQFFADRDVMEVQTPVLVSSSCTDPNIPSIVARPDSGKVMFLHTSPEHAMKRLLCAGSGDIYQIGPVFRDGEAGRHHNPEFTMIEWYRLDYDYRQMARETVALIQKLLGSSADIEQLSYRDAFIRHAGVDPHLAGPVDLTAICADNKIAVPAGLHDKDDLLDLLLGTVVAPGFATDKIYVLYDYPASQAALARIRQGTPPVAERFEVFYRGMELANGFQELADPAEQRRRFTSEQLRYAATGKTTPPVDENLLAALACGLPDCAGVALGFDRLLMLAADKTGLADVIAFPIDRA